MVPRVATTAAKNPVGGDHLKTKVSSPVAGIFRLCKRKKNTIIQPKQFLKSQSAGSADYVLFVRFCTVTVINTHPLPASNILILSVIHWPKD